MRHRPISAAHVVFIVVYLCYVFILTLVFADETATILDSVTELYRMLGLLVNYYL